MAPLLHALAKGRGSNGEAGLVALKRSSGIGRMPTGDCIHPAFHHRFIAAPALVLVAMIFVVDESCDPAAVISPRCGDPVVIIVAGRIAVVTGIQNDFAIDFETIDGLPAQPPVHKMQAKSDSLPRCIAKGAQRGIGDIMTVAAVPAGLEGNFGGPAGLQFEARRKLCRQTRRAYQQQKATQQGAAQRSVAGRLNSHLYITLHGLHSRDIALHYRSEQQKPRQIVRIYLCYAGFVHFSDVAGAASEVGIRRNISADTSAERFKYIKNNKMIHCHCCVDADFRLVSFGKAATIIDKNCALQ